MDWCIRRRSSSLISVSFACIRSRRVFRWIWKSPRRVLPQKGRMAWQRDSGYNQRAGVEGQFARWKRVIGDGLRFHGDEARATEVAIAAQVLNRMLDLGRPDSVRVA